MRDEARTAASARRRGRAARLAGAALLLAGCGEPEPLPEHRVAGGDPAAGRKVMQLVGCGACHAVPGVPGARGTVGPPLDRFAERNLIGGVAPNRPSVLIEWVRAAPDILPDTAMPHFALTDAEARDVAAFLYTLR
jgi:cytochrome c